MQQWTRSFTPRQYRLFGGIISGAVRAATAGTDDSGSNEDATHAAARGRANRADGWLSRMRPEYERAWRQMYTFEPTPKPATKRDGQHKDDDNGDLGAGDAEQDDGMGLRGETTDELRATEVTRSQKRPRLDGGGAQEGQAAAAADDAAPDHERCGRDRRRHHGGEPSGRHWASPITAAPSAAARNGPRNDTSRSRGATGDEPRRRGYRER